MHQCCLRNCWPIAAPLYKTVIITGGRALPLLVRQRGSIHCDILLSRGLLCDPIRDYLIMAQHHYGLVWEIWANVSKNVYEREEVAFFAKIYDEQPMFKPCMLIMISEQWISPTVYHVIDSEMLSDDVMTNWQLYIIIYKKQNLVCNCCFFISDHVRAMFKPEEEDITKDQ